MVDAPILAAPTGRKSFPQRDGILKGASIVDGKIFALYEKNASSQLKLFDLEGKALGDVELPGIGSVKGLGGSGTAKKRSLDSSLLPFRLRSTR